MFWFICVAVLTLAVAWYALQDCDINLKFWDCFGESEDKVLYAKVAFITGAGSGIGKALALRWTSKSVCLVLNDHNESALKEVKIKCLSIGANEDEILLLPGDVTDELNHEKWIAAILKKYKKLDILVNNAGCAVQGSFAQVPFSIDRTVFDLNVMAPVGLTKAALPHFLERRCGYVVQVSSTIARFPAPTATSYGASKAAVQSYFLSLRAESLKDGLSVTVVCPGPVQTNIIANSPKIDKVKGIMFKPGMFPKMMNAMSRRRCAELISKAMVNKIGEAWICTQPISFILQSQAWSPTFFNWLGAAVLVPFLIRLLGLDQQGLDISNKRQYEREEKGKEE